MQLVQNLKKPIDNTDKDLVVQYEVKFQTESGMSCGGAYIKLLEENYSTENFAYDTPYVIMFGPDKCGSSDKVHFIFRHFNPSSKKMGRETFKKPHQVLKKMINLHIYIL